MKPRLMITILSLGLFFALLFPISAWATQVVKMDFDGIVKESDVILSGKVINIEQRVQNENGKKVPYRFVTISVIDRIKGDVPGDTYTLKMLGGVVPEENIAWAVGDMPAFADGQEVILCLKKDETLYSPIVGFHQGRFNLVADEKTGVKRVYDNFGNPVTEGFILGDRSKKSVEPVTYEAFKKSIKTK